MNTILKGRIVSQYRTMAAFAKSIGWSSRKISKIVNGKQDPTGKDIETMAEALHVEIPSELQVLFFSKKSPQLSVLEQWNRRKEARVNDQA